MSLQDWEGDTVIINSAESFLAPIGQIPNKEIIYGVLERCHGILTAARQKFIAELEKLGEIV